jgi:pilin isopeptide linkage protein
MEGYSAGTTLTFNMDINSNAQDLIYTADQTNGKGTLEIIDVMSDKMSLATTKNNYFVVTDASGNTLTMADSEDIGENQYYVTQITGDPGTTTYKIIVPDGMKLHIKYLVTINAAVGEEVTATNKAYFNYDGLRDMDGDNNVVKETFTIVTAKGSTSYSADDTATFQILKQDQWGKAVEGAAFALYKLTLDSSGAVVTENGQVSMEQIGTTATTGADGTVSFTITGPTGVYCYKEISVPTGYVLDETPHYFEFVKHDNLGLDDVTGISDEGAVFTVTNTYHPADLAVPVTKTINNKKQSSNSEFTFILEKKSGGAFYSDEQCTTAVTEDPTVTITGSGTVKFDTIYFDKAGTYTFWVYENDLTADQTSEGYTKDETTYTLTVTVEGDSTGLHVTSATYNTTGSAAADGDLVKGDTLAFNNTLRKDPVTVTLTATKVMDGYTRIDPIKEGEFTFEVVEKGQVIATGKTEAGADGDVTSANIVFESIRYDQENVGRHVLTIYEVEGEDSSIDYSTVKFFAFVDVEAAVGSTTLTATVTYQTKDSSDLDKDGYPVFTNTCTTIQVSPTGIPTEFVPFVMMAAAAVSVGAVLTVCKWRRRKARN